MGEVLVLPPADAAAFMRQSRVVWDLMPANLLPAGAPAVAASLWNQAQVCAGVAFAMGRAGSVDEDAAKTALADAQALGGAVDGAERWEARWVPPAHLAAGVADLAATVVVVLTALLDDGAGGTGGGGED
ncbi:MAG: hypothetical protein LBD51_03330 [Bifidobacteriaceae bacterium]|jgi:hypothetical protein|nr:hypothetical protein [Bifidobacteriaceae bacterium]